MNFDISSCGWLMQRHLDWLTASGVPMTAINKPYPVRLAHGHKAADGRFDLDPGGPDWFVFTERDDLVFWRPRTGELATWDGRAFALGEKAIDQASTYCFGFALKIFESPLDWLRAGRDGVVILNWWGAYDGLQHCPSVELPESLEQHYEQHMQPRRMPQVFIRPKRRGTAA
ncbi:hypothetical protein [Rhizobium ruizarguesonis]|uniref:hypothetical protein n=1 Tax=Rhizobium ruizarguesonis TaxID=2081791 RepID=UPI00372348F9